MTDRVLIIDGDEDLVRALRRQLEEEGFRVLAACSGVEGLDILQSQHPSLVLLDPVLPCMSGWELCRWIRECSGIPIIVLTALARNEDKVRGLELGADDYVTKPFHCPELIARVHAVLRRSRSPWYENVTVRIDDRLLLDRARCQAIVDGQKVALSSVEYKLLECFVDNPGRVLTHQSLLSQIWGWEYVDERSYLKVYVCNLRKKIERNPRKPEYILTERGLGYRFQAP